MREWSMGRDGKEACQSKIESRAMATVEQRMRHWRTARSAKMTQFCEEMLGANHQR
jgi:hypothetical protein